MHAPAFRMSNNQKNNEKYRKIIGRHPWAISGAHRNTNDVK